LTTQPLLTFVHISDTHFHPDPGYIEPVAPHSARASTVALIEAVNTLPMSIDFVLHTGDVVHHPQSGSDYTGALALLSQIRHPVHYLPGNHDNLALFQSHFLGEPDYRISAHYDTQFAVNGVQVVLLDSHAPADESGAFGYLADEQLAWIDAICAASDARPLVVGVHHHPIPLGAPWIDTMVLTNGMRLHESLLKARQRLRGVFYGHIHESVVTMRDGIAYFSAQSAWFQTRTWVGAEAPVRDTLQNPGFNLVTLTENDTFVRFVRVPMTF